MKWKCIGKEEDEENYGDIYPTPISKIKPGDNGIVQMNTRNTMVMNGIEVDITYMDNLTRFGISPFAINMTHTDSDLDNIFKLQMAIGKLEDHEKQM